MKKLAALMLIFALMLTAATALADTTQTFDDFTITIPDNQTVELGTKANNEVLLTVYGEQSEGGITANMNIVWVDEYMDVSSQDLTEMGKFMSDNTVQGMESIGIVVTDVEVIDTALNNIGGKPAIMTAYTYNADYTGMGVDLNTPMATIQAIVSEQGMGTYIITMGAEDMDRVLELAQTADTISWK